MTYRRQRLLLLPLLLIAFPCLAITTAQIAASALSPECVKYRVVGMCYWLQCSPFGCRVRTSVKVRHFRPDLVVSVYGVTGKNPWVEMSPLSPPSPGIAEGGGDTNPRAASQHSKVRFKNADAIGFPAGDQLAKFSPSWLCLRAVGAALSALLPQHPRCSRLARRRTGNDLAGSPHAGAARGQ